MRAQERLISHLGIERLLCVVGGSMGGMMALVGRALSGSGGISDRYRHGG